MARRSTMVEVDAKSIVRVAVDRARRRCRRGRPDGMRQAIRRLVTVHGPYITFVTYSKTNVCMSMTQIGVFYGCHFTLVPPIFEF